MSRLFSPLKIRDVQFRNRIFVSPMCQYSAQEGLPNDWHLVHLGSRAVGGAGLVIAEATAVSAAGRISPGDLGLWNQDQVAAFKPITRFIREQGAIPGVQIAHAGRKASTKVPWEGHNALSEGAWLVEAPSAIPFAPDYPQPRELRLDEMPRLVQEFRGAAARAQDAGFQVVEIHMAHGYLLHEFLSPLSNTRSDAYGGSLENRMRLPLEVARAVREELPSGFPVFARISVTDWAESGGWDLEQSIVLARELKEAGIDLIDCSTGGTLAKAKIPVGPGYQVPFSEAVRREAGVMTSAVGMITQAHQAEEILKKEQADAVCLAREFLRDPYFPLHAAKELGVKIEAPKQYGRAFS